MNKVRERVGTHSTSISEAFLRNTRENVRENLQAFNAGLSVTRGEIRANPKIKAEDLVGVVIADDRKTNGFNYTKDDKRAVLEQIVKGCLEVVEHGDLFGKGAHNRGKRIGGIQIDAARDGIVAELLKDHDFQDEVGFALIEEVDTPNIVTDPAFHRFTIAPIQVIEVRQSLQDQPVS